MKYLLLIIVVTSLATGQWSGDGSGGWNDDEDEGSGGDDDEDGFSGDDYDEDLESGGPGKDVVELTEENFEKKVLMEKETGWLVDFYVPWCPYPKRLDLCSRNYLSAKPWAEAATKLKGKMNLGALDASQHKSTADKFDEIEV